MKKILLGMVFLSTLLLASENDKKIEKKTTNQKISYGLSIGAIYGKGSGLYKVKEPSGVFAPIVSGSYKGFYLLGSEIGYKKAINPKLEMTMFTQIFGGLTLQGVGSALGGKQLEGKNLDIGYRNIDDRDTQVELGFKVKYTTDFHGVMLDGSIRGGEHGGSSKVGVSKIFIVTRRFIVVPEMGFTVLNESLVNYYFGINNEEVARDVNDKLDKKYSVSKIGYAPSIGLTAKYYITRDLSILGLLEGQYLSDEISESPIVKNNTNYFAGLGLTYTF